MMPHNNKHNAQTEHEKANLVVSKDGYAINWRQQFDNAVNDHKEIFVSKSGVKGFKFFGVEHKYDPLHDSFYKNVNKRVREIIDVVSNAKNNPSEEYSVNIFKIVGILAYVVFTQFDRGNLVGIDPNKPIGITDQNGKDVLTDKEKIEIKFDICFAMAVNTIDTFFKEKFKGGDDLNFLGSNEKEEAYFYRLLHHAFRQLSFCEYKDLQNNAYAYFSMLAFENYAMGKFYNTKYNGEFWE